MPVPLLVCMCSVPYAVLKPNAHLLQNDWTPPVRPLPLGPCLAANIFLLLLLLLWCAPCAVGCKTPHKEEGADLLLDECLLEGAPLILRCQTMPVQQAEALEQLLKQVGAMSRIILDQVE
jgi:hypothetical protein